MKRLLIAGVAALTLLGANAAMARVDVGISIGVPGVLYAPPPPVYYAPPVRYVEPPPVVVVPERRYYRPVPVYEAPRYYYRDDYRHDRKHWKKWRHHRHDD